MILYNFSIFFFKQKTAYEMRISDWSSDVCSSDLHEDLTRLGQHPLLTRRQAALLVAAPQVADDLAHLDDVTGGQLLEVGLVTARPVGGLLREGSTQHLEDLVQALLADHIADADQIHVLRGNLDYEVSLRDVELQVLLRLALDDAVFDLDDRGRSMMGVHDGLANLKKHAVMSFRQRLGYHSPRCDKVLRPRAERAIHGMEHASGPHRSEEHTSELQSLMRNSYAVFCLKQKKPPRKITRKR